MSGTEIGVCHRNRLFSECLSASLTGFGGLHCTVLPIESDVPGNCTIGLDSQASCELLLLDVALSGDMAFHVAETVRQRSPQCKLLLLVAESAAGRMLELTRYGSQGCLFEEVSLARVREAIDTVLSGHPYCSPELANALMAQIGQVDRGNSWSHYGDDVQLTAREREVLQLIAWENLGNKQIARRLDVSLYTVKNHVHNIIEKLGVTDRYEAVRLANRRKLLVGNRVDQQEIHASRIPR